MNRKPTQLNYFFVVLLGMGINQILPYSKAPKLYELYVKDASDYVYLAENKNGTIHNQVSLAFFEEIL